QGSWRSESVTRPRGRSPSSISSSVRRIQNATQLRNDAALVGRERSIEHGGANRECIGSRVAEIRDLCRRRNTAGHDQIARRAATGRSEEHTSELQSLAYLVC